MSGSKSLSSSMHSTATLKELASLISLSVDKLRGACDDGGLIFPSLNDPEGPTSDAFRQNAEAAEAARLIAAAAFQLTLAVLPPAESILGLISGHLQTAALRVCLESNVTDILFEGGPNGIHVRDIAEKTLIPEDKLERILRYLATQHVYREVIPHVFTNTRLSSLMGTGKPVKDLLESPDTKHDNTLGIAALLGHHFDEVPKASAYLFETLSKPPAGDETTATALNEAFGTKGLNLWQWFGQETNEQQLRKKRFDIAMRGVAALQPAEPIIESYSWGDLPQDSVVVDVGGGLGTSSIVLAQKFPKIKFVVQDLDSVIAAGKAVVPSTLKGRVEFEVQNFFEEQNTKREVSVFLLKHVLHDWLDSNCEVILGNLRNSANDSTRLVLLDSVIPYACSSEVSRQESSVKGGRFVDAPTPLLPNYGIANGIGYGADMAMMTLMNAQERTLDQLKALLKKCGWEVEEVKGASSVMGFLKPVIAKPCAIAQKSEAQPISTS